MQTRKKSKIYDEACVTKRSCGFEEVCAEVRGGA